MAKTPQTQKHASQDRTYLYLSLVTIAAAVCFYPLSRYYFLQDDFILIANAAYDPGSSFSNVFGAGTGLFRPLTKVFYFKAMYGLFGLNPVPYHLVSLVFHIVNVFLFHELLRTLKIGRNAALIVTSVFAFHVGFLDVIAWISCIQQLMGQMFMLIGLIFGIRAVDSKRPHHVVVTSLAYVFALLSVEQTYPLPLILFAYVFLNDKATTPKTRVRKAFNRAAPYLAIMFVYLAFMLAWKGIPEEGPYHYNFGTNIFSNLLTYLVWVVDISVVMPFVVDVSATGLVTAHLLILLLVIYNLARQRSKIVIFATAYYFLAILPVLFLEGHAFYLHNYIPSFGVLLLAAPAVEDFLTLVGGWRPRMVPLFTGVFIGLLAVICFTKVRTNESNFLRADLPLPKNFVLRRAVIAKNVHDDVSRKTGLDRRTKRLFMIYKSQSAWYKDNVVAALGKDSALKLFYANPKLDVFFHNRGDTLFEYEGTESTILFFDHLGHCFTPDEVEQEGDSGVQRLRPN